MTHVSAADSADFVQVHGQSFPMATAASTLHVSADRTNFSDILVSPDGLV